MKTVRVCAAVVPLLWAMTGQPAWAETFHLKSGDTVTGELMGFDGQTYRARSKYGILSFDAKDVTAVAFNAAQGVVEIARGSPTKDDRDRIRGTVESYRNGVLRVKTAYGYLVVEQPQQIGELK